MACGVRGRARRVPNGAAVSAPLARGLAIGLLPDVRPLRRISRLVALVLGVVLASVSLAGGGSTCMMSDSASMPMHAHMRAHDQPMTPAPAGDASPRTPAPCHLPTAPNACPGMATCASVALPSLALAVHSVSSPSEQAVDRTAELVAGDARAPELPPPRA